MSSEDEISSPTDLDPRIFRRILNMPFYTSQGDIDLLERMKERPLTDLEKDAASLKRDESEIEDAQTIFQFIQKVGKLKEEYTYNGETYSDQVSETIIVLRNWSDTGWDRADEHRRVGDLLEKGIEVNKIQKKFRGNQSRLQSKSVGRITQKQKEKDWPKLESELMKTMIEEDMTEAQRAEEMKRIREFKEHYMSATKKKKKSKKKKSKKKSKKKKTFRKKK